MLFYCLIPQPLQNKCISLVGMEPSWQSMGPACSRCKFDSLVRERIFLPESTVSADSLTVSVHPPIAIACIYICAHVKDPVVHVRVQWIMETLKHLACMWGLGSTTLSQLAFQGEGNPNFPWEISHWNNTIVKSKVKKQTKTKTKKPK